MRTRRTRSQTRPFSALAVVMLWPRTALWNAAALSYFSFKACLSFLVKTLNISKSSDGRSYSVVLDPHELVLANGPRRRSNFISSIFKRAKVSEPPFLTRVRG